MTRPPANAIGPSEFISNRPGNTPQEERSSLGFTRGGTRASLEKRDVARGRQIFSIDVRG